MQIAVVGAASFIATALRKREETRTWRFLSHDQAISNDMWLKGTDGVLNCAFDDRLKSIPYDPNLDIDFHLAQKLANFPGVRYVMLSSRLVYGPAPVDGKLTEHLPPMPVSVYGKAKLITEMSLERILGNRLTILRLANIFGEEDRPGRQNFIAVAMRNLQEKDQIFFDMSPFVRRDFLPVESLVDSLIRILVKPTPGLFNLGSGCGTEVGKIALWLIKGFGRGSLLVTDVRDHDAYWLDIEKAGSAFDLEPVPESKIQESCLRLGADLSARIRGKGLVQCA